ncbi:MAG: anthranilate synthase component I family protein [Myxococcota bacterium]|nr:anthranilate synthase component I family protein [Myxococcota bacterium]
MWGLPTLIPWTAIDGQQSLEIWALNQLSEESELVGLIGTPLGGPRGRFGVVGIPTRSTPLLPDGSNLPEALRQSPNHLKVVGLGYDLGRSWARLSTRLAPRNQPSGLVFDLESALIVDHTLQRWMVAGTPGATADRLLRALSTPQRSAAPLRSCGHATLHPLVSDQIHGQRIRQTHQHIAAGDIYQANIARRLGVLGSIDGIGAITDLSLLNPVAHGAYLRSAPFEVVSNTMETLMTLTPDTRTIASFPIKGTCKRSDHETPTDTAPRQLLATPKERAEHIMIVDLVRNDLGRICTPGSIKVPRLMGLEGYQGVWHGVSTIEGTLAPNETLTSALHSLFPGGSITGAPKRRAIEIITDLEEEARGFYTGSIGLVAPNGYASFSILIRTLLKDAEGWSLSVGGGIVADSTPEREIAETWEKVAVFQKIMRAEAQSQARSSTGSNTDKSLLAAS